MTANIPRVILQDSITEYPDFTILCYDGYAIGFNDKGDIALWNYPKIDSLSPYQIGECMKYRFGNDWLNNGLEPSYDDIWISLGIRRDRVSSMILSFTINKKNMDEKTLNVGFEAGYNKAKETLYTEEDLIDAIGMARNEPDMTWRDIIQSLKQPKL